MDLEARTQISKLWTALRELASALWGDDRRRDNGLRSDVRKLESRIEELVATNASVQDELQELRGRLQHYLDAEREASCHGLRGLAEHKKAHEERGKEEVAVKVAEISAGATKSVASWKEIATIFVAGLVLAGQVINAQQAADLKRDLARYAREMPETRYPAPEARE